MTSYEIPLSPEPQRFNIKLAGVERILRFYWNGLSTCWCLDIFTGSTPLLQGVPIITGIDLLAQHKHLNIGGSLIVQTDYDLDAVPTFDNLGQTGHLYFIVE
jgi:hypothetical protein